MRERSSDDELIVVLPDKLVERGQRHSPATNGIEDQLIAPDIVPQLVLEGHRTIGFCERLFFRQGDDRNQVPRGLGHPGCDLGQSEGFFGEVNLMTMETLRVSQSGTRERTDVLCHDPVEARDFRWQTGIHRGKTNIEDPLVRLGMHETAYFTFSLLTIRDGERNVIGLLARRVETTIQVLVIQRQQFTLQLAVRIRQSIAPDEAIAAASELIGQHLE